VLTAPPGYRFTDSRKGYVSLINRASVSATEDLVGAPVDPLRFRGNLYLDGLAPWAEPCISVLGIDRSRWPVCGSTLVAAQRSVRLVIFSRAADGRHPAGDRLKEIGACGLSACEPGRGP
jgi:hypothetical protein